MDASFFQLNRRSRCLFTPDSWCDFFNPASPVGPLEFLCNTTPQRVTVVLPTPPGEAGHLQDRIFASIAAVWEDRRIGFLCERVSVEAWTAQQPCAACTLVRTAQVIILDAQAGNQRAGSFRDLATTSFGMLKNFKETAQAVNLPSKRVIFISCGPAPLPPHYASLFDVLDYADAAGQPDLDHLQRQMLAIARSATLFELAAPISIQLDGQPATGGEDGATAMAGPAEVLINILEEAASPPPPASTPATAQVVRHLASQLKVIDSIKPVSERFEYETVKRAVELIDESRFVDAIHELNCSEVEEPELRSIRKGMVMDCLDRMDATAIVTELFATGPLLARSVSLSGWSEARVAGSTTPVPTISVWAADRCGQIANRVQARLLADLQAEDMRCLRDLLQGAGGTVALLVPVKSTEEFAVGPRLAQYREGDPAIHLIELRFDEIKRQIIERTEGLDYLHSQVEEHFLDAADLYRKAINQPVFRDGDFFGRKSLIESLKSSLTNGNNFAIFGLRRAGKSSLLRRLELVNKLEDHVIVRVDLAVPPDSADDLYYRLALAIRETLESKYPPAAYPASVFPELNLKRLELFRLDPESSPGALKKCFVKDLGELLSDLGKSSEIKFQKLILLLDEIESILPDETIEARGTDGYRVFLAQLRHLLNHSRLMVGMVGYGPVLEREFRDHDCPLYSQLQLLPLGMLTQEECSDMVRSIGRKRVHYADESLATIFEASGGDPQLTKYLCAEVLGARPRPTRGRSVDGADVRKGIDSLLTSSDRQAQLLAEFETFARYFPAEAGLVEEIAGGTAPGERVEITWEDARRKLTDYGLLVAEGKSCALRIGLLHRVLCARLSSAAGRKP